MKGSKILQLLAGLDHHEMVRLSKFVASPFHNNNSNVVRLFQYLKTAHPTFHQPKLKKERVFQRLYPDRAFNYQLFSNQVSILTGLVEQFLIYLQLEEEQLTKKKLLLKAYSKRPGFQNHFKKQVEAVDKSLEKKPFKDAEYFHEKFKLEELFFNHISTDKFKLKPQQYEQAMHHLDLSYILDKLLLSCEMKAREKPLAEKYDIAFLEEIKNELNEFNINSPVVDTYLVMLNLLEGGAEVTYFDLKKVFNKNINKFEIVQQKNILQSLINYAIQKINKGDYIFLAEILDLYKLGLKHQLFLTNGILNDKRYISIVIASLKNKAHNWALEFMEKNSKYLETSLKADALSLAKGLWLFDQKKSAETIDLINNIEFKNTYYQEQTKVLLLKSYFEEFVKNHSYLDVVISQSNSFERFVKRSKIISKSRAKNILNFIWAVKQMTLNFQKKEKLNKLKTKFKSMPNFVSKAWLMEKIK